MRYDQFRSTVATRRQNRRHVVHRAGMSAASSDHSVESCLFPIQGKGVHQLTRGSRAAIEIYDRLLATRPDDLQSRYLLNLAHMTLGQYPDGVPSAFLIPPSILRGSRGDGFPRFADVATSAGVAVQGISGGTCVEDFDGDGLLDIFASSYGVGEQVRFFLNRGDGSFDDRTEAAGLLGVIGGLNAIHADFDNDGRPDILVLRGGWLGEGGQRPNSLLRNLGDGRFADVAFEAGLSSERPTQTGSWGDFDGDGWLDLFIGNESRWDPDAGAAGIGPAFASELYRNNRDGTFTEIAASVGLQDIYAVMGGAYQGDVYQNALFENPGFDRSWVTLIVTGKESNRSAIGANVTVRARQKDGRIREYHRVVTTGGSFGSSSLQQEIGLGDAVDIESVEVVWPLPSRTRRTYEQIEPGHRYHLIEDVEDPILVPSPIFSLGAGAVPSEEHQHH